MTAAPANAELSPGSFHSAGVPGEGREKSNHDTSHRTSMGHCHPKTGDLVASVLLGLRGIDVSMGPCKVTELGTGRVARSGPHIV